MSYVEIFADSNRGQYIPQYFAESVKRDALQGVKAEDLATLESGPDAESYWEVWESVLNNAELTDAQGRKWKLHQDGDLFFYRTDAPESALSELMGS